MPLSRLRRCLAGYAVNPHRTYRLAAKGDRSGESITVYFCRACNAHYTNLPDFDYETQDEGFISYYEAHRDYILWRHNLIFDYLERTFGQARGRFLDIGSGAGYSLEGLQSGDGLRRVSNPVARW